jgi:hypothetical protein
MATFAMISPWSMIAKQAKGGNAPNNDRFPLNSRCGLSYQACPIPRIVRLSGIAGLRGSAVRYYF